MESQGTSLSVGLAWLLAILTVVAAVVVVFTLGVVDIPYYGSITRQMVNWPIIIWCAVGAIYAVLYAVLFTNVHSMVSKTDQILRLLQVGETNAASLTGVAEDQVGKQEKVSNSILEADDSQDLNNSEQRKSEPRVSGRLVAAVFVLVLIVLIATTYLKQ